MFIKSLLSANWKQARNTKNVAFLLMLTPTKSVYCHFMGNCGLCSVRNRSLGALSEVEGNQFVLENQTSLKDVRMKKVRRLENIHLAESCFALLDF